MTSHVLGPFLREVHLQQLACVLLQELADRVPESRAPGGRTSTLGESEEMFGRGPWLGRATCAL